MNDTLSTSNDSSGIRVVAAGREHLAEAVSCHADAMAHEVIALLGPRFMRAHHRFYIDQPDGICLVALDDQTGRVAGLVMGGGSHLRRRFLRKYALRFGLLVLWKALTSPAVRARIRLAVRGKKQCDCPPEPSESWAVLLWLGTHPDFRRRGVGRALAEAFGNESARRGYKKARLTVAVDNAPAIELYKKAGWKIIGTAGSLHHLERDID